MPTIVPAELGTQGDGDTERLTDGDKGGTDRNDGSWVKLTAADNANRPDPTAVVTFNFGRIVDQSTMRINYLVDSSLVDGVDVKAPLALTVETSTDGQTFDSAGIDPVTFDTTNGSNDTGDISLLGCGSQFVRLTFTPATNADDIYLGEITFNPLVQILARDTDSTTFFSDAANNRLLFPSHGFENGQEFRVQGASLPDGLEPTTTYFVVNKTDNNFQVAETAGGTQVTFTSDGMGTLLQSVRFSVELKDVDPIVRQFGGGGRLIAVDATDRFQSTQHRLLDGQALRLSTDAMLPMVATRTITRADGSWLAKDDSTSKRGFVAGDLVQIEGISGKFFVQSVTATELRVLGEFAAAANTSQTIGGDGAKTETVTVTIADGGNLRLDSNADYFVANATANDFQLTAKVARRHWH